MPAGATHQFTNTTRRSPGLPGMIADISRHNDVDMLVNINPQAAEVWTCVISNSRNSEAFGVNLTSPVIASVSYTSDSSSSKIEIAAGLAAAWNASPICRGFAQAVSDGIDTVTFTGVAPGLVFAMEEDENADDMALTNTTNAAEADSVPFGRAMVSLAYQSNEPDELGILAKSSVLTAQVDTLTVDYVAGEVYYVDIEIEGETYGVGVAADTDDATTATAIATALNLKLPAVSVLAAGVGATVTLTAELAGKAFVTKTGQKIGTAASLSLAHTTSANTDFNKVFAGVSIIDPLQTADLTTGLSSYGPNVGVNVLKHGRIWVENTETITHHASVYVELDGTGSNAGKFYAASSATRVKVDPKILQWRRSDHAASGAWSASDGDVAQLSVDCPPA